MNLDMVCKEYREASKDDFNGEQVLKGKELWFAYEKGGTNTLRSLDVELKKGEILSLVGGNGAGKSTLLKVLSGVLKPYRGKIKKDKTKNLAMLPQSPQALFTSEELLEDLLEGAFAGQRNEKKNKNRDEAEAEAISMAKQFGLEHKLDAHPFDLSGGEMQRAAIAKLLLTKARILLLDEPTKGLDGYLKNELGKLLQNLAAQGISILMVTHDLDFSAEYSHRCAMLFDGQIISVDEPHRFFAGNRFYTTAANQIAGNSVKGAILVEEVVECLESILQETRQ